MLLTESFLTPLLPKGDVLFSWRARENRDRGAGGVTDEPEVASTRLTDAMTRFAPGAIGSISQASLDRQAPKPSYIHGEALLEAHNDRLGMPVFTVPSKPGAAQAP